MHPKKGKAEKIWRKFSRKFQGSLKEVSKEVLQNFHKLPCSFVFAVRQKFAEFDNLGFVDFGKICRIRQINFSGTLDRITFKNFREFSKNMFCLIRRFCRIDRIWRNRQSLIFCLTGSMGTWTQSPLQFSTFEPPKSKGGWVRQKALIDWQAGERASETAKRQQDSGPPGCHLVGRAAAVWHLRTR